MPDVLDIPLLTGPTLTLRPHTAADVDAVLERCRHPDTIRWTTVPDPYTREMAQEYLAGLGPSAEQVSWAIERGGTYAGTIDLDPGVRRRPRIGQSRLRHPPALPGSRGDVRGDRAGAGPRVRHARLGARHLAGQRRQLRQRECAWRAGFPPPVLVPALLLHRGRMVDGWHSAIEAGSPRQSFLTWAQVYAVLLQHERVARRPG